MSTIEKVEVKLFYQYGDVTEEGLLHSQFYPKAEVQNNRERIEAELLRDHWEPRLDAACCSPVFYYYYEGNPVWPGTTEGFK